MVKILRSVYFLLLILTPFHYKYASKMETTLLDSCGYLNVAANKIGKLTIKVFDTNGRIAKRICRDVISGVQKLDLNISDLSNGTYIFNAFNGDTFIKAYRFIKQ